MPEYEVIAERRVTRSTVISAESPEAAARQVAETDRDYVPVRVVTPPANGEMARKQDILSWCESCGMPILEGSLCEPVGDRWYLCEACWRKREEAAKRESP